MVRVIVVLTALVLTFGLPVTAPAQTAQEFFGRPLDGVIEQRCQEAGQRIEQDWAEDQVSDAQLFA